MCPELESGRKGPSSPSSRGSSSIRISMIYRYDWWRCLFVYGDKQKSSKDGKSSNRNSKVSATRNKRMLCDGDDEDFLSDLNCFKNEYLGRPRWVDLAKLSYRVFAFEGLSVTVGRNPRILLQTLAVMALIMGGGFVGLNARRDLAVAHSKHVASRTAADSSDWFQRHFQEVFQPLSAMQQALAHSAYFGSRANDGTTKTYDEDNICSDAEILEKWKAITKPFNNNNNLGGLIVGYRLHPANITCLVPVKESAGTASDSSASSTTHHEEQGHNHAAAGYLSSKFWRGTVLDVFSSGQQRHVNVFGPFSISHSSTSLNVHPNTENEEESCIHLNSFQDNTDETTTTTTSNNNEINKAAIDLDSILNIHGYKIPHAIGFVMDFVNNPSLRHTYDRFAEHQLQFYLTRIAGPDAKTGKYVVQNVAFSEQHHLLNENNSIVYSLDVTHGHGHWIIRVGKTQGWNPRWYPYVLTALILFSVGSSLAVAMVLMGKRLHQNILDELMSKATSSQLQQGGGQTLVEKFHFVTIFSSDIVSITSSLQGDLRQEQMRTMINNLYAEFDKLVEKHEVLKVETIGDTYMIVSGAPNRCTEPDAAERVALFALDAMETARNFQAENGEQMDVRAGIASGPVVAGVLGDAVRRYCFSGNTVSYATQMESTSAKMRIQCADSTYRLLLQAPTHNFDFEQRTGKQLNGASLTTKPAATAAERLNDTSASRFKGKKQQQTSTAPTWWIKRAESRAACSSAKALSSNVTVMTILSNVGTPPSRHQDCNSSSCTSLETDQLNHSHSKPNNSEDWYRTGCQDPDITDRADQGIILIDRITSILLQYAEAVVRKQNINAVLSSIAKAQLRDFVVAIENTYNDNHFHSFFHAYHVIISMEKLVKTLHEEPATRMTKTHFHQDPLNAFALIFSALIHDAGHTGMTNKILLEQGNPLANRYNEDGDPIAERYSLDLAFERLFNNKCDDFLSAVISTEIDKIKLCQVLFHSVLSTDITSKDRNQFSIKRYQIASDQVFDESVLIEEPRICPLASYLKHYFGMVGLPSSAIQKYPKEFKTTHSSLQTCVLNEHIMLVSDIAHLMQCWNNFVKWNFRLYKEIKSCHDRGLCDDPTNGWYDGQIWFLVNYVIPLATRFKSYFTSSFGDDLVKQAERNLHQWKIYGGKASKRMADAVIHGDDESRTLAEIYLLPKDS